MIKRLYFDIETMYGIYKLWSPGKQYVGINQMIEPGKIVCIAYKWEHEKKVNCLTWDENQNEHEMLKQFVEIMNEADEIVSHNGKNFDHRWVAWECIKHRIPMFPSYKIIDSYMASKAKFRAPSHKLDYLCWELFGKRKEPTGGMELWDKVKADSKRALTKMESYCKNDVLMVEELYQLIDPYINPITHVGVLDGKEKWTCARCGSENVKFSKRRVTAMGTERIQMQCSDCHRYFTISATEYKKFKETN